MRKNIMIVILLIGLMTQSAEAHKAKEKLKFSPMHTLYKASLDISDVLQWRYLSDRIQQTDDKDEFVKRTEDLYKISSELHSWLRNYGFYEAFVDEKPNAAQQQFLKDWQEVLDNEKTNY